MRQLAVLCLALALLLAGCAARSAGSGAAGEDAAQPPRDAALRPTPTLVIEVNGKLFYATPEDNASARALTEKLNAGPVTVETEDRGGCGKEGHLPWSLPEDGERVTAAPGDLGLSRGDTITLCYDEGSESVIRLARIGNTTPEELSAVLGEGGAMLSLSLEWSE